MDKRTHTALLESIEKWKRNRELPVDEGSVGVSSCPLCKLFHPTENVNTNLLHPCRGCPVREHTGVPHCRYTPYIAAANATTQPAWTRACDAEIAFLESLLPGQPQ